MNHNRDLGRGTPRRGPPPPDDQPTTQIPRIPDFPQGGWHAASTQPIPTVPPEPGPNQAMDQATEQMEAIKPAATGRNSLIKASGSMAVATLISRATGFAWKLLLAMVIGFGVENDSFTVANTLPNSIFELLLGGVLTSVVVPVLVRASKSDADGGEAYVQRLLSLAAVILLVGTALSVVAAPLLTWIFIEPGDASNPDLTTAFAYLLLPQIFFYGISALVGAILQSQRIFSPPAWAPVVNNMVVIATIGAYMLIPGRITVNPVQMTDAHLLTLGLGVTLGVLAQAAIQLPALRRTGFRLRWRFEWDARLSEFGGLTLWMLGYVGVSQVGLVALSRVATGADAGGWSIYNYAWMLLQLPYGVIGFSVMTAILPRMSAAAADGDNPRLISDLSLGNRLSTVALLPISALMTALGVPLVLALFSLKHSGADASKLGLALAVSAFGVLPYAITMMQMRTFNAMKDARTPTLIMVVMTIVKVLMAVLVGALMAPENVVYGLTFVNSFSFVVGWLVGEAWLRRRLGPLGSRRYLVTLGKTLVASIAGGLVAWLSTLGINALVDGGSGLGAWLQLIVGMLVGTAAIFGLLTVLRVAELQPAVGRLTGLLRRR